MHKVNQVLETQPNFCLPFVGGVTFFNTSRAKAASALKPFHRTKNVIKLKIQGQRLTSCTDTGAQVSMTTKSMCTCNEVSNRTGNLLAGDFPRRTLNVHINLTLDETDIEYRVYVKGGTSK